MHSDSQTACCLFEITLMSHETVVIFQQKLFRVLRIFSEYSEYFKSVWKIYRVSVKFTENLETFHSVQKHCIEP